MIEVGEYTYVAGKLNVVMMSKTSKITIGKFCSIGGNVSILGGGHNTNWITTYPFGHINKDVFSKYSGEGHPKQSKDVIIGSDVWIGGGTTIMEGVIIGDGAVIAANSHVVKGIGSYSVVGGNPAKFIRQRFSDEIVEKLLVLKWWDWEKEVIDEMSIILCSDNLEGLFGEAKRRGL